MYGGSKLFGGAPVHGPGEGGRPLATAGPPGGPPPAGNIANLLAELASAADPDMALLNLTRFVEAKIAPARFLHSFFLNRPIARLIITIF